MRVRRVWEAPTAAFVVCNNGGRLVVTVAKICLGVNRKLILDLRKLLFVVRLLELQFAACAGKHHIELVVLHHLKLKLLVALAASDNALRSGRGLRMVWIQRVSAHETREHPAGRNAATGNGRALVVIPVLEFRRHVLEIGFRAKTNPGNSVLGTKLHWLAVLAVYRHPARNRRLFNRFPFAGAATIDLKSD